MELRLRQLHEDQSGYTLPELLTAAAVGLVVMMAAMLLFDHATSVSRQISDRQDAVQRGRLAMEIMTRQLRSQVCLGETTEPITYGDSNRVSFYADLSATGIVQKHTLAYEPATRRVTETIYRGTGTYPDLVFPTTPTRDRILLSAAQPIVDDRVARPVLRYYAFKTGGVAGDLEQLPVPLTATDASRTVMLKVGFVALPEKRVPTDLDATTFENDVYVRLADPARPTEGPRCL